jgi:hypothetical protein
MSTGPPSDDSVPEPLDGFDDRTYPLDYPDRDIRVLPSGTEMFRDDDPVVHRFGDFNPDPDDPDPDVWPLEGFDPGYPADVEDLIMLTNSFPEPHVSWVTSEYLRESYGYDVTRQEIDVEELPPWRRPDDSRVNTVEVIANRSSSPPMSLTPTRLEALKRVAKLWNGDFVQGKHLLCDKLPTWGDILGDLDQDELKRLVVDPSYDYEVAEAFDEYSWFTRKPSVYLYKKWILSKPIPYCPTLKGRTLINRNTDLPSLVGDPNEGLPHRVAVGLTAVREQHRARQTKTYYDDGEYTIDLLSRTPGGEYHAWEVMTRHNNWELYRDTYRKLETLANRGVVSHAVFDKRTTAYRFFDHVHNHESIDAHLPGGPFDSDPDVSTGQDRIEEAFESRLPWSIKHWTTTSVLWRETLGQHEGQMDTDFVISMDW